MGKSQAIQNHLRICVSFDNFGNANSRISHQTQILDKFIRGLKPKTRIEIELRDPKSSNEAYKLTNHFDRIVYDARNTNFLTQNYNHYTPTSNANMNADYDESMQIDTLQPHRSGLRNFQ